MISHREVKALKSHWFQILLAFADHDLHGLAIMREVSQSTEKRMHLWPGMLYGSLKRMADEDLVTEIEPSADAKSGGPLFSPVVVAKRRRRRQDKARAGRGPQAYLTVRQGTRPSATQ